IGGRGCECAGSDLRPLAVETYRYSGVLLQEGDCPTDLLQRRVRKVDAKQAHAERLKTSDNSGLKRSRADGADDFFMNAGDLVLLNRRSHFLSNDRANHQFRCNTDFMRRQHSCVPILSPWRVGPQRAWT